MLFYVLLKMGMVEIISESERLSVISQLLVCCNPSGWNNVDEFIPRYISWDLCVLFGSAGCVYA